MAIYFGNQRTPQKIHFGKVLSKFEMFTSESMYLLSSDNKVLQDNEGKYIVSKDAIVINNNRLLSSDGYVLQDIDGVYIIL
jgi:hypothetical protein